MRKLIFLILGLIIALLIVQYMMDDDGRRRQRVATPTPPEPDEKTSPRRWQGTDEMPAAQRDDLTSINGIGPSFEKALHEIGIFSFAQLAVQDVDELASRMRARVTSERIRRDRWIEQARALSEKR